MSWFFRTTLHVAVILLALGCDGSPGPQESLDDRRPNDRPNLEPERIEFFGEIVDPVPGPDYTSGGENSAPERQGPGHTGNLAPLPAPVFLKAGIDPIYSVAFSPDNEIVAGGDGMNEGFAFRGSLYLWESRSGKLIRKHEGFRRPVERICFSDTGKVVAASPEFGGPVIVWDVGQEARKAILPANSYVLGLTSETEALVAAVGDESDVSQWNIARWTLDQALDSEDVVIENAGPVSNLSGNKRVLFGYYPDGKVVFWSTGDWKKLGAIDVGQGERHSISDDGQLFAVLSDVRAGRGSTTLDIWDVRDEKLLRRYRPSSGDALCNMVFHSSAEILVENYFTYVLVRDLNTGEFFATWSPPRRREGRNEFTTDFTMTSWAVSRDGEALAAGLFHTNEVALFRIVQSELKRLRDTAKTSPAREALDAERRRSSGRAKNGRGG